MNPATFFKLLNRVNPTITQFSVSRSFQGHFMIFKCYWEVVSNVCSIIGKRSTVVYTAFLGLPAICRPPPDSTIITSLPALHVLSRLFGIWGSLYPKGCCQSESAQPIKHIHWINSRFRKLAGIILDHYMVRIKHFRSKIAYRVYVWMSGGVQFGGAEVRGSEPELAQAVRRFAVRNRFLVVLRSAVRNRKIRFDAQLCLRSGRSS